MAKNKQSFKNNNTKRRFSLIRLYQSSKAWFWIVVALIVIAILLFGAPAANILSFIFGFIGKIFSWIAVAFGWLGNFLNLFKWW